MARFGECDSGCFEDFATQLVAMQPRDVQTCQCKWGSRSGGSYTGCLRRISFLSENAPDLKCLRLRDPGKFIAGGVHGNPEAREVVLKDQPSAEMILDWIKNKIVITHFCQYLKGAFKGSSYDSDFPLPKQFHNHASCSKFTRFVLEEILRGSLYKSGPLHFGSKNRFPSNFPHESMLV